jgi:hypothetical protein
MWTAVGQQCTAAVIVEDRRRRRPWQQGANP